MASAAAPVVSVELKRQQAQAVPKKQARKYVVCAPDSGDVPALSRLHDSDYVMAHRRLYSAEGMAAGAASCSEWDGALGSIDFRDVVKGQQGKSDGRAVRLLKCIDCSTLPASRAPAIGYVLYELREKGSAKKQQRYCEIVNIVVDGAYQGHGIGRLLFEEMCKELERTAPSRLRDLRLYVAEANAGPRAWYERLGFKNSGWQTETIGGSDVKFVRMIRAQK